MGTHEESQPKRVQRDESNPFDGDDDSPLLNIATGVILPAESTENLLKSTEMGKKKMDRLHTSKVSFWEPLKQLKIKTFASTNKKVTLKSTNKKVVTIESDRNFAFSIPRRFTTTSRSK